MALAASDVFVVQKQAGGEIRKVTAQSLSDYLASGDTVVYKGVGDFTDVSANPASPNSGDLWINNALNAGPFAWLPAPNPIPTVQPGDRCIYDGAQWDIISSGGGDAGVEAIDVTAPITLNDDDSSQPIIGILDANTTRFGAVQLATQSDVDNDATNRVVTADLLKVVDDKVDAAVAGGVTTITGVNPIEVDSTDTTSPEISIKDSAVSQKGAIAKFDTTTNIGGPQSNTDYTTWLASLNDTSAVTIKAVGTSFLLADFSEYADA
jgi:hypothetical protein